MSLEVRPKQILNLISNESLSINEQFNLLPKFYIEKSTVHLTNSSDVYIKKLKELYMVHQKF